MISKYKEETNWANADLKSLIYLFKAKVHLLSFASKVVTAEKIGFSFNVCSQPNLRYFVS